MIINKENFRRFFKFAIVGGIGAIVDFSTFSICAFFLKSIVVEQVLDLLLPVFSYEIAVVNNFLFSYFWVWKDRKRNIFFNFLKYNLTTLVAFIIRYFLFQGIQHIFAISVKSQFLEYMFVYALSIGVGMTINFLLIEFQVFKKIE
jgi:putative flippase GtrA